MAFKQVRVSDISGNELKDEDVVTVNVKSAGKVFDASEEELNGLKRLNNVVQLELRHASGVVEQVLCTQAEFAKLVTPEQLESFDNSRGRRTGFSPRT